MTESEFTGAVIGKNPSHNGQAFLLNDRQEVYFTFEQDSADISLTKNGDTLAAVYYISQYEEYCVIPFEYETVYLISGQPLGKDRRYFLPRGTEILIKYTNERFELG